METDRSNTDRRAGSGRWATVRLVVGIGISAVSLLLLVSNVDWGEFWRALSAADYWWLVPAVVSVGVSVWFKVLKWELLMRPTGKVSRANLFHSMMVGYLVNTVLPGRLGEVARVYLLARLERVSPVSVLSTVAVDRILDVVMLAVLMAIVLPTANVPSWLADSGLFVGVAGVLLLALCLLLAYPWGRNLFMKALALAPRFPGKGLVERWAEALIVGVEGLRGTEAQLKIAAYTMAVWLVTIVSFYLPMLAFHLQASIWASTLVLAVTNLGMVVPSSPGYIGVYHYLVVVALAAFGVPKEVALGYAVVTQLVGLLPVCLAGVFSLWRCGVSLMGWREPEGVNVPEGTFTGQPSARNKLESDF